VGIAIIDYNLDKLFYMYTEKTAKDFLCRIEDECRKIEDLESSELLLDEVFEFLKRFGVSINRPSKESGELLFSSEVSIIKSYLVVVGHVCRENQNHVPYIGIIYKLGNYE